MSATAPTKKGNRHNLNQRKVKRKRKMLDFSSIPLHLQIGIAEKIDCFDQREFELSSKRGKYVINFTKHKAVVELYRMNVLNDDIRMYCEAEIWKGWKKGSEILQFPHLPRFKVKNIDFCSDASIAFLIEMCGRQLFVANEVFLFRWWKGNGTPDFSTLTDVFFKFFNITNISLVVNGPIEESLFALPEIREMRSISIHSPETPDDILLQLRTKRICLYEWDENRVSVTTNLFLKEWFGKKRSIEWFDIETKYDDWRGSIKEEIVFSGLPYSVIWKYSEDQKNTKLTFLKYRVRLGLEREENLKVNKKTTVYSIDRGDIKLLVVFGPGSLGEEDLMAQEYTQLDDVIRIKLL